MAKSNSLRNFNGNPNYTIDYISRYLTPDARRQADGRFFPPSMMTDIHVKCRDPYEYTYRDIKGQIKRIKRHPVPAGMISWDVRFEFYDPISFDAFHLTTASYADPDITKPEFCPKFNQMDGNIDRRSHEGIYRVVQRTPLNVRGRTGLTGRGVLGRYGPNHAVDPIVTRWKTHPEGGIIHDKISSRPILQFVAVQRRDTNDWALPGGKYDEWGFKWPFFTRTGKGGNDKNPKSGSGL